MKNLSKDQIYTLKDFAGWFDVENVKGSDGVGTGLYKAMKRDYQALLHVFGISVDFL